MWLVELTHYLPGCLTGEVAVGHIFHVTLVPVLVVHDLHLSVVVDPQSTHDDVVYRGCHLAPCVVVAWCREHQVGNTWRRKGSERKWLKGKFILALYPILTIAQSALCFIPGQTYSINHHRKFSGKLPTTLQLMREDYSYTNINHCL